MGRHPTSSHMPAGAGVLSAGFWGSPRPCHSANLGINRAGRQILPLGGVCLLLAPWMEQSGRSQWPLVMLACQDTLVYPSWTLRPARGFPTMAQTSVRSWDKDFPGYSCATATRTGCNLLAAACFVINIMIYSPSSPCVFLTGKSLQAIILGLFSPADSERDGQRDCSAGGREKECGIPRHFIPPHEAHM